MSKRDAGTYAVEPMGDTGDLLIRRNGVGLNMVLAETKPALLAALLEDAGAVRVRTCPLSDPNESGAYLIRRLPDSEPLPETGWFLPVQDGDNNG